MSIIVKNLTHIYNAKSPFETIALKNISFEIEAGEFTGLIGHTGSGKSTLIQHLNGLLKAESGTILVNGLDITGKEVKMNDVRKKVGLVFQYPEYQLFEETVKKDVAFGPGNLGLSEKEVHERVREAIETVGLDYEAIKDRSPFELSGGQRRRVAIAGIIAMKPEVLILDEPTAGLDPRGRSEILEKISLLHKKYNTTVLLISHSMEDIASLCGKVLVINKGKIDFSGTPKEVFSQVDALESIALGVPQMTALMGKLSRHCKEVKKGVLTEKKAKKKILRWPGRGTMLRNITIGQYYPVESLVHRRDPRLKIMAVYGFVIVLFMIDSLANYAYAASFLGLMIVASKVPLKYILKGLKPIFFIIFFTFTINMFLTRGEIIYKMGIFEITSEGLHQAVFMSLRLVFLIIGTSILTLTTSPIELTDGIERLLNPFRKIGVPAHELAMMMTIALRFIPTILEETDKIMKAQMARGADFESGNIVKRAKSLIPLLVPLFIGAFRRADDLAMAMEARCYRGGENRTRMKQLKLHRRDIAGSILTVSFYGYLVFLSIA